MCRAIAGAVRSLEIAKDLQSLDLFEMHAAATMMLLDLRAAKGR